MMDATNPNSGGRRLRGDVAVGFPAAPLVSVITAVFNGQTHVANCLESVLGQDYTNIEHIVLDGGSTDGTTDVLRTYDDRIALWKSETDCGVYDAWNKGLREAHGEWICFLGIDDEFLPGAVSAYIKLAARRPDAEYLSSRVRWVHPPRYNRVIGSPWNWKTFSRCMCTAHVGSMHRRSLYERLGEYDTSYRSAADYELLLRARGELRAAYMPDITVMMRAGGISDSRPALAEARRAKILTGSRNPALAALEYQIAIAKQFLRPVRQHIEMAIGR
jgi:glycosyltransferase involved in cell wall biosynthesis